MSCTRCLSLHETELNTEINLHFSGLTDMDDSGIFVFPKVLVCLDCGLSQFIVGESELAQIVDRSAKRNLGVKPMKTMRRRIVGMN